MRGLSKTSSLIATGTTDELPSFDEMLARRGLTVASEADLERAGLAEDAFDSLDTDGQCLDVQWIHLDRSMLSDAPCVHQRCWYKSTRDGQLSYLKFVEPNEALAEYLGAQLAQACGVETPPIQIDVVRLGRDPHQQYICTAPLIGIHPANLDDLYHMELSGSHIGAELSYLFAYMNRGISRALPLQIWGSNNDANIGGWIVSSVGEHGALQSYVIDHSGMSWGEDEAPSAPLFREKSSRKVCLFQDIMDETASKIAAIPSSTIRTLVKDSFVACGLPDAGLMAGALGGKRPCGFIHSRVPSSDTVIDELISRQALVPKIVRSYTQMAKITGVTVREYLGRLDRGSSCDNLPVRPMPSRCSQGLFGPV